jgi:hypothetical protein
VPAADTAAAVSGNGQTPAAPVKGGRA